MLVGTSVRTAGVLGQVQLLLHCLGGHRGHHGSGCRWHHELWRKIVSLRLGRKLVEAYT